eukprot:1018992-Rhodomonas_salina.1
MRALSRAAKTWRLREPVSAANAGSLSRGRGAVSSDRPGSRPRGSTLAARDPTRSGPDPTLWSSRPRRFAASGCSPASDPTSPSASLAPSARGARSARAWWLLTRTSACRSGLLLPQSQR